MDGGRERLILGFDGGCATCSDLAKRIEEKVGDRLEVLSLHDPRMENWREQALGEDAPWAPTLVEVGGVQGSRAWTGAKMAVRLGRALGLASTWRVMQALGEIRSPKVAPVEASASRMGNGGMSRGQFLKGVGGAAVGFGFLFGAASPARAVEGELDEEGLAEAFTLIEQIPPSVMARGNEAARNWLRAKLREESQSRRTQGFLACSKSVVQAVILNVVPVGKIRAAIRAFGGGLKLARFIVRRYRLLRSPGFGYSKKRAIRRTARAVAIQAQKNTGEKVFDAILILFDLDGVRRNCF